MTDQLSSDGDAKDDGFCIDISNDLMVKELEEAREVIAFYADIDSWNYSGGYLRGQIDKSDMDSFFDRCPETDRIKLGGRCARTFLTRWGFDV